MPIADSVGNTTSYSYDAVNRVTTTTDPLLHSTTFAYNAAGEMTSETDRDGRVRNFGYDAVGRQTSENWLNSLNQAIYTATYTFDAAGNLSSASDANSSNADSYDAANRLTSVDNLGTPGVPHVVLNYGYDVYNNRTSLSDSLGGSASYTFDADHQLTGLSLTANRLTANAGLSYDAANRLTDVTRNLTSGGKTFTGSDTIQTTFSYDGSNRLTNITHSDATLLTTLASYTYGFDAANQLTSYSGPDGALNYSYDANGQLTGVTGSRAESFSYDTNGNRTMAGYTTGTGNELTSDGTYNYTYDNEGNTLTQTRISDGQVTNYSWDYRNRLTEVVVKTSGGTVLNDEKFTFDVNNNRIGVMLNGAQQSWTVFDGANPYMDFNGSGAVTQRYLTDPRGVSQFYARVDPTGVVNWYLTDNLGSIRQIVDTSGNVVDTLVYSAFGSIVSETNATNGDRFKYTGGANDSTTGNDQFGLRYYGPGAGRFVSQDPIGFGAGDTDLYRYVFNSAINRVDPSGLATGVEEAVGTGIGIGAGTASFVGGALLFGLGAFAVKGNWFGIADKIAKITYGIASEDEIVAQMNGRALKTALDFEAERQALIEEYKIAEEIKNMAKGARNIRNAYLEALRRSNPKATKQELCDILAAAYLAARKAKDYKLAATIKMAQKALGCRRTHRD